MLWRVYPPPPPHLTIKQLTRSTDILLVKHGVVVCSIRLLHDMGPSTEQIHYVTDRLYVKVRLASAFLLYGA